MFRTSLKIKIISHFPFDSEENYTSHERHLSSTCQLPCSERGEPRLSFSHSPVPWKSLEADVCFAIIVGLGFSFQSELLENMPIWNGGSHSLCCGDITVRPCARKMLLPVKPLLEAGAGNILYPLQLHPFWFGFG